MLSLNEHKTIAMRAHVITARGPVDNLVLQDVPTPTATIGKALIHIKSFGINHAEVYMRNGEWSDTDPITGVECVGMIEDCPGGEFEKGTPVATMMGGLGRANPGTYAEYTVARISNIAILGQPGIPLPISWEEAAALPISYGSAWTILFRNLDLKKGQKLLVRGGSSAFGKAAIDLALQAGAVITATTREASKFSALKQLGISNVVLEGAKLPERIENEEKFDCGLDLIGNTTFRETATLIRRGGRLCLAGFLGGQEPVTDFQPVFDIPTGVQFSIFASFAFGEPGFPLSDIPFREMAQDIAAGKLNAKPVKILDFANVREAHRLIEANQANGKIVVTVN